MCTGAASITTPGIHTDDMLPGVGAGFAARPAADQSTGLEGGGAVVSPRGYDTPLPPDLALRVAAAPVARHLASRLRAAGLSVSVAAAPEGDGGEMAHLLLVAGTARMLEHEAERDESLAKYLQKYAAVDPGLIHPALRAEVDKVMRKK